MQMLRKVYNSLRPRLTSRRERMIYWLLFLGFTMFMIAAFTKASITETVAMYVAMSAVAGWYCKLETDKPSDKEI